MDKTKFGFFNPSTETFMVVENIEEFRILVQKIVQQKKQQEEIQFQNRMAHQTYDDFDYVIKEVASIPSYSMTQQLMEYDL